MTSLQDRPINDASPRRSARHGLAERLAVFAFFSAFVTSLAVTWAAIDSSEQSLNKIIDRQVPASLRRVAHRQVNWIRSGEQRLTALSTHLIELGVGTSAGSLAILSEGEPTAQGRFSTPLEAEYFSSLFSRWVKSSTHFRGIAIVTAEGEPLAASSEFDRLAFASAVAGPGTPRLMTSANRQFAITPLRSAFPPGTQLVGDYLPFALERAIVKESLLPGATVAVFDPSGSFALTASDARAPSIADPGGLVRLRKDLSGHVQEYRNESGEHVIGCSIPFGLFGWQIAIEAPFDVAYEPVMSAATRMLAIDLCIVLAFSFVAHRITTIMLRPIEVVSEGAQLIANGVIDHEIAETGRDDEVGLLARSFNQMMRNLRRDRRELEEAHRALVEKNLDLKRANEVLNQLSITDGLTKVHNHRFFQDHLTREIKRVNRLNEPLAIILMDVDDFKSLNDRFGHAAGDEILVRLARIMESSVRETDLLARYGGEEFAIIASNTDSLGAYQLAEKIRTNIAETSFTIGDTMRTMRITVSIGVAKFEGNRKKFFLAADRALYSAKAEGKNCVVVDESIVLT